MKTEQETENRENCSFGNHLCNGSLHIVHGTLFGEVEMNYKEITHIILRYFSLSNNVS